MFRFLVACVLTDLAPYIDSILKLPAPDQPRTRAKGPSMCILTDLFSKLSSVIPCGNLGPVSPRDSMPMSLDEIGPRDHVSLLRNMIY